MTARGWAPWLGAARVLGSVAGGCVELPAIDAGVCGNLVVEPGLGEECDGPDPEGRYACRGPGAADPCRFDCSGGAGCPAGHGCGGDGVCRQPSGGFELVERVATSPTIGLVEADLDGDGQHDLVRSTIGGLETTRFRAGLSVVAADVLVGVAYDSYALADFMGHDGRSDAAVVLGDTEGIEGALGLFAAHADGSLAPASFANLEFGASVGRVVAARVLPPFHRDAAIGFFDTWLVALGLEAQSDAKPLVDTGVAAADLAGVAVADLDEDPVDSPCEEIAFAARGAGEVWIYEPCRPLGNGFDWNVPGGPLPSVSLAGSRVRGVARFGPDFVEDAGLFLEDLNGDGHRDLLVAALAPDDAPELRVAWGVGDGTFHSDPSQIPSPGPGDQTVSAAPFAIDDAGTCVLAERSCGSSAECAGDDLCVQQVCEGRRRAPLAVADFNGDGVIDLVTGDGIFLSRPPGPPSYVGDCPGDIAAAAVADFDGNGTPDLALGLADLTGLLVQRTQAMGAAAVSFLPASGFVHRFTPGDFDGDGVADLLFADEGQVGDDGPFVKVMYGEPQAAPAPPHLVVALPELTAIAAGRWYGDDAAYDAMAFSRPTMGAPLEAAALLGSVARQIQSPYVFGGGSEPQANVTAVAAGRFAASGPGLVVFTSDRGTGVARVWLAQYDDAAGELAVERAPSSDGPSTSVSCVACRLVAVDLDDDGIDEALEFTGPEFVVHRVAALGFEPDPPGALDATFSTWDAPAPPAPPLVADVDGDGRRDVVMASQEGEIIVYWNDGDGTLHPASATRSSGLAAAALQIDATQGLELIVAAGAVTVVRRLLPASRAFADDEAFGLDTIPFQLALGADLDGDGVDDLVLGDIDGYTLLRGVAVKP